VESLVIVVSAVLVLSRGQTHSCTHTDRHGWSLCSCEFHQRE